tara:strand:- start:368 stop:604 length:237 start_codon:yes stop_codon:yes gene_type:complete
MPNTPYMTKKHFTVLADELGHDKFYYNSKIAYHEKLARLTAYCIKTNIRFDIDTFNKRIEHTYNRVKSVVEKQIGGTI